ncbi:MAG: hypothetical protein KF886_13435 [Candidatus Hydrogenedentes bacterium]|nr:hypothetical protein [Candidatus Hydrogenedentota bacterium]
MFPWEEVYPEILRDGTILNCPGPAGERPENPFTDQYYVYTGYLLTEQADLVAFADAYSTEIAGDGDFSGNLPGTTSYGNSVFRLREGIERFLITDVNSPGAGANLRSTIPVMWDWPDNHDERYGSNVLYMDGHVKFVHFGEKFPITEEAFAVLAGLANHTPPTDWAPNEFLENYPYATTSPLPGRCGNNMRHLGLVNTMFANNNQGKFLPPLSNAGGRLMLAPEAVYPEYINDPIVYTCPGRESDDPLPFFDDVHYAYLGYLMLTESDVQQFAAAYTQVIAADGEFTGDLDIATSYGNALLRLREDIVEAIPQGPPDPTQPGITQKSIPVLLEWPENHESESGGNVLFLDGHVEWMPYPGEFPMTETVITTLRGLAQNSPATTWADSTVLPVPYRNDCASNLNQWSLVQKMYANEHQGYVWPPLSLVPGELVARDAEVYPEYMVDREIGVCPGAGVDGAAVEMLDDRHYVYLGYVLLNDSDVQQFVTAYGNEIAGGGDFSDDIAIEMSYGDTMVRIRERIERYVLEYGEPSPFLYVPRRTIPVMIEWPGNHEGYTGGHVLYMDGHVEWIEYPGKFPMTEATIAALDGLADWTPTTSWTVPRFQSFHDYDHGLCASAEKQVGLAFKIYASTAEGEFFPPLSAEGGTLMMDDARFLKYDLRELRLLNCPGSANAYRQPAADDHSYAYLGYVIRDQEALERFATAYGQQIADGGDFTEDLAVGEETVYRLREGVERFLITDINNPGAARSSQKNIPVLVEWPDNHGQLRGGNVLYMDGHTEWLDYPGEFPMTEEAMAILTDLAGRGPIREAAPPQAQTRLEALLGPGG